MTLLSEPPGKPSVGYISSYPEFIRLWFRSNSQKGRSGKTCTLLCNRQSRLYRPPRSCFRRVSPRKNFTFYLDLNQHMGSSYLCVYVCHRFPGGPRPASSHHDSAALSPAVTFSCSLDQDPCSLVPGNGRRLQTYLGKQRRKRRMQIYPQRPCLSNKSKSWFPRSTRAWLRGK